ncbi:hypothetical protein [Paenibacillus thiaminolyticus]|uniref:Uncharacterized protein n=1 Tax=Paenibacillus thiaminolyticus TaxID=49283 RepID=A0A3A3GVN5_PANTH|nr:hypothetical protein [Paenibacillus thiaminolyticus]RJG21882.1 hypothetical protein DQX05_19910 [Paenibacillus thiaminolyticus]
MKDSISEFKKNLKSLRKQFVGGILQETGSVLDEKKTDVAEKVKRGMGKGSQALSGARAKLEQELNADSADTR